MKTSINPTHQWDATSEGLPLLEKGFCVDTSHPGQGNNQAPVSPVPQGSPNVDGLPDRFTNHAVVKLVGKDQKTVYDPSYGKPYEGKTATEPMLDAEQKWEDDSVVSFYAEYGNNTDFKTRVVPRQDGMKQTKWNPFGPVNP